MKQKTTRGGHEPYWALVKRIITESDLVLEILDARLVELSRNERVEELVKEIGRPIVFVINKSDLVSRKSLKEQIKKLKESVKDLDSEVVFISAKKKGDFRILLSSIKKIFKRFGKREATVRTKGEPKPRFREAHGDIVVGVLGYPNTGKSSIINALAHKKKVKVSKKAGTTHGLHWVNASGGIRLIDSPGVIPLSKEDEVRYGLIGAKDTERLKNPLLVAHAVIKLFLKSGVSARVFEEFYNIKIVSKDVDEIIRLVAEKKGFLLKGGRVDENRVVSLIVRDWQQGRLRI